MTEGRIQRVTISSGAPDRGRGGVGTGKRSLLPASLRSRKTFLILGVGFVLSFYLVFQVFPIGLTIVGSFFYWSPLQDRFDFAGLHNYRDMLADPLFFKAIWLNFYFTAAVVALRTAIGLGIALAIMSVWTGKGFFRTIYFLPVIAPMIAVSLLWKQLYDPGFGLINVTLHAFGMAGDSPIRWLRDTSLAMPSIIVMTVWKEVGYAIVIFLAALAGVPRELYEAARIDGARPRQTFLLITLPMIRPAMIFVVITSIISYLQAFGQIFIMTKGGPAYATFTTVYQIFDEAFILYNFGKASAISLALFAITLVISMISIRVMGGDDDR